MLPPDELRALGKDIKANGLRVPVVLWKETLLCPYARVLGKAVLLRSVPECSG